MKKLLLILLCLPMIGFGQDKNLKKSKFNFNKSNNYGSNMKSDAEKACDFTTQIMEMMPQLLELSMKAGFGDEDSKKEAQKVLDEHGDSLIGKKHECKCRAKYEVERGAE